MAKKQKVERIGGVTEIGTIIYPFLNKARDYEDDGKFAYSCGLVLTGQDAASFEKQVDEWLEESKHRFKTKKLAGCPYDDHVDDDDNVVEGATHFRFKVRSSVDTKKGPWDRKPNFFDSAGLPVLPSPLVGAGTRARIDFDVYMWKNPSGAGITLQPLNVQIVELVEYVPQSRDPGFGAVEGGTYTAPEKAEGDETDGGASSGADF